uniref:kinesin-like protein KIF14 isoform X3 n=1 Tax=Styela clava TaxID=7725 RepID=UPI00193AD9E6|nr:kinesin-like protein KIF14 isoform X3 [Styela clava]
MSSRAITQKRKAFTNDVSSRKGSPHTSLTINRKYKSSLTSTPIKYSDGTDTGNALDLSRSPKFFKVNLDKENNNTPTSTTSKNTGFVKTSSKLSTKLSVDKKNSSTSGTTKSPKIPPTNFMCASSVLSTTTSSLARHHRKSHADQANTKDNHESSPIARRNIKKHLPEKMTPGMSPYHGTPPKRRPPETEIGVTASPSFKSIPNDMVRKMVKNIQDKPPSPSSRNPTGRNNPQENKPTSVRKNLASRLGGSNSIKRGRSSFALSLAQNVDRENLREDFSVTVAVRVRPFSQKEEDANAKQVVFMNENGTLVSDGTNDHNFSYDFSFDSIKQSSEFASQSFVYQKLARPLLSAAFNGYNTCLFAYGQTGSGKSYTIMGNNEDVGVIPRFCDEMFGGVKAITSKDKMVQFHIEMSYFEIYNEKIHDLLVSSQVGADGEKKKQALKVREHPEDGPYVEGLSKFVVTSFDDIQSWLDVGNRQRVTASTGMNDKSSRSHSVFILNMTRTTVEKLEGECHATGRRSRINLVDLAGSERSSTAQTSGQRLKKFEGASINKSLLTLGKVIFALSERSKVSARRQSRLFIPYRDSALTWLLKESLGGNSRTAMIATVSPAEMHIEETLSTLRYAAQARTIVNMVKINEDPNAAIIRELKSEIAKLRAAHQSSSANAEEYQASVREIAQLREKLSAAENDKNETNIRWLKKLEESEKRKAEEIQELKRAGVSFKVDNRLPNLVNLNEDPQLSELLLYVIKHGTTRVGRKGGPHECEIQLGGTLIADLHCEIENKNEVVTISPKDESAKIFINGEMINKLTTLHHADRIVIAGDHFFRLNHPIEVQRKKKNTKNVVEEKKDFEFAKNELLAAQNARMEAEIEQTRLRVKQEMMKEIELAKREAQNEISEQKEQYEKVVHNLQTKLEEDQFTMKELEGMREEYLVLQKEVDANRKRQEMEARILAQKTVIDERDLVTSHIFAELEAERLKLAKDIERMQNNLKKKKETGKPKVSIVRTSDKFTPLRVSLLLEEANTISTAMKTCTVFSRHDVEADNVQIKVQNTKLEIYTLWSMEKFEEKLEGMRESYDAFRSTNNSQNDGYNDPDHNIFYDPADTWWEVFKSNSDEISRDQHNSSMETPISTKPSKSRRITRRLSSLTLARTSPALQQSLLQYDQHCRSSTIRKKKDEPSGFTMCKNLITSMSNDRDTRSFSSVDCLLISLHKLSSACDQLEDEFCLQQQVQDDSNVSMNCELPIQATMQLVRCQSFMQTFCKYTTEDSKSKSVSKLVKKLDASGRKLTVEMAKLLQGCEGEIEQMVKESLGQIKVLIPNISKYSGALSLLTNDVQTILDEDKEHLLSHRIKNAFIQGADSFLRKTIAEGLTNITNCKCLVNGINTDNKALLHSAIVLLQSCKDLQEAIELVAVREVLNSRIDEDMQRICESSLLIRETELPPQYYQQYINRARDMTSVISKLVTTIGSYNTACAEGDGDTEMTLEGCEEIMRDCAMQIAFLSSPLDGVMMKTLENNSNCNNSNSVSFEEETERMYYAVQDAAEDFRHTLTRVFNLDYQMPTLNLTETPVDKNFPKFPLNHSYKSNKNIDISCSTAISNSVKKWLDLTDCAVGHEKTATGS